MAINELEDLQRGRGPSSASGNEYDAMISDQADSQKNVLRGTMFAAARKQPDRQAQVMELAQRAKLPASVVERNFDDVSKKVNEKALDYDQMIEQTPGLAKWMENTENAALGREDLDPLGRMDKNARALNKRSDVTTLPDELRRAGTTGFRGIESSSWHLAAAYGLATPEEAAEQVANANRRANELREMAPDYAKEFSQTMAAESGDVNKAWNKFTGSYKQAREGKILQAMMDWHNGAIETVGEAVDMIGAAAVRPRGLMYSTVENLANSLPSILTGVAGAKVAAAGAAIAGQLGPQVAVPEEIVTVPVAGMVGFAAGSFMGAVPVEVGAWINSEMQSRGVDVTDAQAITAAYKDPKMMADIRAEAERKGLTTAGVDALFNAFAGRLVKGAKPGMASKAIAGAKEIGIQTAGEVTSEYAGQVAAKEGDLSKTNFGEAIQEGIISLGHSAADVTVGASMRAAFNKNPTRAAEEVHAATETALQGLHEAQLLGEMGKAAKELKHTGTVPGKVAELLDAAGAPSSVYFQTKDWDAYWRSKGKSPAKAAEQLMDDGGKAYFEAKKTGRDIEIPFSSYIDKTARTEDFDGLLPSAKTSPGGMSATEAREHLTTLPATMNELAKEVSGAMAQDNTAEQSAKEVGKTVSEQLKEVGVDPDQAVLYEEGFRVLGERMGVDPKELFDQYKLRITGSLGVNTEESAQTYDQGKETKGKFKERRMSSAELEQGLSRVKEIEAMRDSGALDVLPDQERQTLITELNNITQRVDYEQSFEPRNENKTQKKARLARAREMGFDTRKTYYHGTTADFAEFNGDNRGAIFFTDRRETAQPYADQSGKVMEVFINKEGFQEFNIPEGMTDIDVGEYIDQARASNAPGLIITDIPQMNDMGEVVYKDTWVIPLDPKRIRSVNAQFSKEDTANIYAQAESGDLRGQIRIGKDGINISILKNANASTFIHETGHFYLEVLKDLSARENAPAQIKQDFEAIREWLGAKPGEELTVDQHEQFARGFEGYLLDGKAPTSKLAEAFSRFKVWLLSVYRKMRPNVEFSKEVREVMNRLFATDEELAIAQGDYPPLFNDLSAIGMNKKQEDRYIQARMEARLAAEEELTKKLMADFRKSEQQFYKEKRKGVREEVEAELRATREYTAVAILQGEFTVGKDDQNFKINTKSLKDIGAKVGDMPRGISAPDGLHVEMAAELLNYLSGADLVKALTGLPKLDVAVEKLTDQRMAEYYPDSLVDGTIGEEALKAMHNEKRAELLEMELAHLAIMDTSVLKDITRRVVRRPPSRKQVREEAIRIIGTTKPKDLKPPLYQRAEVKAAKEAGQALVKGDIDAAFEAKQRELLNHELYRQASAARDQINAAMVDFRKFRQSDEKLAKNRDMDLVNTGRAILAAFGVGQQEADQYLAAEILSKMQKYDPEMYQTAKAIYDDATENGAGPWQNVPFDDFAAMQQSVDALWDLAKNVKQIEVDGKKMDLEQVKGELIAQSGKFTDKKAKAEYTETAGPWQKTKSKLLSARADLIRVEHWAEAMDVNGNREFTSYMFRPIADAATKYRLQKVKVIQAYEKIIRAHEQNMTRDPIESAELGHRFKTKTELLMAVLHSGNESNLRKLLVGRGWGTVDETGRLDTSKWDAFIKRMQDTGVLTKADYDFTQQIWDLMESLKPGAQQAHKQMYGYYFKEITTDGFSTPFGDYRGGYIPAKIDVNESEDIDIRQERESFEKNNNSWQFPTTGRGFTKSRVEQYAAPLTLDMNMLGGHIDSVLRFTNIEPRVKEVSRIVMDKGFREALRQVDPAVAKDALVPWLQRAAQQQVVIPSRDGLGRLTDAMASHIRNTVAVQIMFGNVTNTLQQLTGVVVAGVKIKPKYLRNALVRYVTDRKGMNEDIQDRSEWMRSIQGATVYESSQAIQNIIVQPSTFENIQQFTKRHTYFLQSATQNLVNNVVWTAGYNQALESGMTEAQAAKEADAKVRMTQGTVNPEDVSRFETGTQTERLFKQFVGYFNMLANLNAFEIQKIARETGLKKGAGRAFYVYSMGVMLPAVLSELIVRAMSGKGFDEDDDDFYLDDAMSAFFGSQFKTIAATVPYGGQVAVSVYNRFNNQRYDDRLSLSPVISVIEGTAGVPYELYKNIAEDADNEKKITKDVLTLVGVMSSLPAGPIGKPVGYLMDVNSGKAQPTGPIDFTRGLVTGKSGNSNK